MRIIVTGSSGLLGQAVASAAIEAGHEVLGLDAAPKPAQATWAHITADLTDSATAFDLVQNADAIFHIAAIPRPIGYAADTVFTTNMALSFNVVEASLRAGIQNFVYASSYSVFGFPFFVVRPRLEYLPIDDRHPTAPQDCYALSKWLGEEVVEAACRRHAPLCATGLRLPWVQTAASYWHDIPPRLRAGEAWRDLYAYIDARDAGAAFLAALYTNATGHRRVLVAAPDANADVTLAAIMRQQFPECRIPDSMIGCIDTANAKQTLGFTPQYSWRDYPKL